MNLSTISKLVNKWFPSRPDRSLYMPKLTEFYNRRDDYHKMVRTGDKASEPQVKLLTCLIKNGGKYAEIGCGPGTVCRLISETAFAYGYDISPIAIEHAKEKYCGMNVEFICTDAEHVPLADCSVSGAYSFEVLEHVWDPVTVIKEMVRITKPGGFIFITVPNYFSLDLHLSKSFVPRTVEIVLAALRMTLDLVAGRAFHNLCPDLDGEVYPDCDIITAVVPYGLCREIENAGCVIDFIDSTYMCAHRDGSQTDIAFQRNTGRKFFRNFGDHFVILAHKKS